MSPARRASAIPYSRSPAGDRRLEPKDRRRRSSRGRPPPRARVASQAEARRGGVRGGPGIRPEAQHAQLAKHRASILRPADGARRNPGTCRAPRERRAGYRPRAPQPYEQARVRPRLRRGARQRAAATCASRNTASSTIENRLRSVGEGPIESRHGPSRARGQDEGDRRLVDALRRRGRPPLDSRGRSIGDRRYKREADPLPVRGARATRPRLRGSRRARRRR
jgi:hypothetical protein